ncbi:MAG: S1 RNA-binding domain-containing protein [Pseudomonadota bacterium]|nr:S1 RNA-binding domain-containing protein [Pseudomonadota bacterium]
MINWSDEIERIFGGYLSEDKSQEWSRVKDQLKQNEIVSGVVVAKAPFGLWVDIGVKFPALIEVIVLSGVDYETYLDEKYFTVGSEVKAKISGVRDDKRQIYLHQKDWPFKINKTLEDK